MRNTVFDMSPTKTGKNEKRERIVEAMMEVIAQQGYERASIQRIAEQAELTSGLLHYYFPSKRQMLEAVIERLEHGLRDRFEREMESTSGGPWAGLNAWIEAHVGLRGGRDERALASWVAVSAEATFVPEVREVFAEVIRRDMARLRESIAQAAPSCDNATRQLAASAIFSAVQGMYLLSRTAPEAIVEGGAVRTIDAIARAILGHDSSAH